MTDRDKTDHDKTDHDKTDHEDGQHSARQLLHWVTGDRDREAKALADAAGGEVSEDDAELAVRRTHGDLGSKGSPVDSDVAAPKDAGAAHDERARDRR